MCATCTPRDAPFLEGDKSAEGSFAPDKMPHKKKGGRRVNVGRPFLPGDDGHIVSEVPWRGRAGGPISTAARLREHRMRIDRRSV
jgi:hypothetical protein